MNCALHYVIENAKPQRVAARMYGIPLSTLRDRLKTGDCSKVNLGRKPIFSKEQEDNTAEHVLLLAKTFYEISSVELRRLVYEYAEANNIQHNFNKISKRAGQDWLSGFLRRNPSVSIRKPQVTSLNRISAFNSSEVKLFFSNLTTVMDVHKFDASRIYNFDETGISTVQKPGKILAPKGAKQVDSATSWERGKNITACCAVSASGVYVPSMFILPRLRMTPALQRGGPPNSIYECSKNGWMTEEPFPKWLKHFANFTKASKDHTILLILDNHTSHVSLEAYNFCKDNGIVVVTLPPHCSHGLQPLDVAFFSSLKAAFNQECDNFMRSNPHQKITPYDICPIFSKAFMRIANIEKGISGFSKTGIFPLNPTTFNDEDFMHVHPDEEICLALPVLGIAALIMMKVVT
ncbi:MFS-type transporter clz9-like [Schistocerca americana]|uniref:MFS-type transporter clz9-like n=1 Tax=Schistocerca americana TaxID=7009 RepID=UPI001F4FE385|nr:MFS-type transporter clz9-like [Schistocerca americana]